MNVKVYYQKIRDAEAGIADEYPIVVSRETADGGKAGVFTEVPRRVAAKLLVDGMASVASGSQAAEFRATQADAKRAIEDAAAAAKVQLSVLPTAELQRLRGSHKSKE